MGRSNGRQKYLNVPDPIYESVDFFVDLIADRELIIGFNIVLTTMQLAVLYFPVGPPFLNTSVLVNEMPDESRFICDNFKINTFKHTSIHYLGVVMILA